MNFNNVPFFNENYNLNSTNKQKNYNQYKAPFVKVYTENSFLNISIYFFELNKKDIIIDYINNFIILKVSFSYPFSNELFDLKRIFYYKNLDFYNYKVKKTKNIIFLKIPLIT